MNIKDYKEEIEIAFKRCIKKEHFQRALTKALSSKSNKLFPIISYNIDVHFRMQLSTISIPKQEYYSAEHPFLFYLTRWSLCSWCDVCTQIYAPNTGFLAIDLMHYDLFLQTESIDLYKDRCHYFKSDAKIVSKKEK